MKTVYGLFAAAVAVGVADACQCNTGKGNTWQENRACGNNDETSGLFHVFEDGSLKCQMDKFDERNACPDYAPTEEENADPIYFGYVWCDCMDEHQRIVKAATRAECLRTEGLSDAQDAAYTAAGIDTRDYNCQCCACMSTIHGVPKVGDKPKTCDAGDTDVDDLGGGCATTTYWLFFAAVVLLLVVLCYYRMHKKAVEKGEIEKAKQKKKKKKKGKSDDDDDDY